MSTLKKFIQPAHQLLQNAGLIFYARPQIYDCSYQVVVKNVSHEDINCFLVVPVVSNHKNQKLQVGPTFSDLTLTTLQDELYGNYYALKKISLRSGEKYLLEQDFRVDVSPVRSHFTFKHIFF